MAKIIVFPSSKHKTDAEIAQAYDTAILIGIKSGRQYFHFHGNRICIYQLFDQAKEMFFQHVLHSRKHRQFD